MKALSDRRRKILDFITGFTEERGYPPSVRDVARCCGITSTSVAQYHLNILEQQGYIRRDRDVSRGIVGLIKKAADLATVPLLGTIAAGKPIPVPAADSWTTAPEETIELPASLTRGLEKVYALKVKGTSMTDALIADGDIVLMQQAGAAENGDTVAAWLKDEQEVTLKKFYREPKRVRLQPANSLMKPLYCRPENVEVQGKVIAVLRDCCQG